MPDNSLHMPRTAAGDTLRGGYVRSQRILGAAAAARLVLSLALTVLLGRMLPPADYGLFALVSAILVAGRDLLDLGTGNLAAREIAREPAREGPVLEALLGGRLLAAAALALLCLGAALLHADLAQRLVLCATAGVLFMMYLTALSPVFQLRQAQGAPALLATGAQLGMLIASAGLIFFKAAGFVYALLIVARELLVTVWNARLALRRLGFRPRPRLAGAELRRFLGPALTFGLAALFYQLYFHGGSFFVWWLRDAAEAGAYAAAFRPVQPLVSLLWILMIPLVPVLSRHALENPALFRRRLTVLLLLAAGTGAVGAVAGYALGPDCIEFLYAGAYGAADLSAHAAFRWLALACGFACLNAVLVTALLAAGQEHNLLRLSGGGFVFNVAGSVLLLPALGFTAAAMMIAFTEIAFCLGGAALAWKKTGFDPQLMSLFALPLSALGLLPVFAMLPGPAALRIVAGAALCLGALLMFWNLPPVRRCRLELAEEGAA